MKFEIDSYYLNKHTDTLIHILTYITTKLSPKKSVLLAEAFYKNRVHSFFSIDCYSKLSVTLIKINEETFDKLLQQFKLIGDSTKELPFTRTF